MAGKLVQVATVTADNTTSSITLTGINTDDVYMVAINDFRASTQQALFARITKGGTADSTNNYDYAYKDLKSYAVFTNTSATNVDDLNFGTGDDEAERGMYGIIYLYNFNNSSEYSFLTQENFQLISGTSLFGQMGGSVHTVASASDGIQFFVTIGTVKAGTFTLYRVV